VQIGKYEISFKRAVKQQDKNPPTDESVASSSMLYSLMDFQRYNPDDLIGRKGYGIYKKMMRDEQVKAAVRFRRNAVTTRGWGFKFEDDIELSETEKLERINVFRRSITTMPGKFKTALDGIMSSMQHGFSLSEKTFAAFNYNGKARWGLKTVRLKPYDSFVFEVDEYGTLRAVIQEIDGKQDKIDLNRMIHHVHNAEVDLYYGQSELREAYRSYWSKDVIIKLENIFLERAAGGFIWAEQETSNITEGSVAHTKLKNIMKSVQTKTGIIPPRGVKIHVEMPKDTEAFDRATRKHDRSIAKALLMPQLLGLSDQGDTGSYSQSQTQLEAFIWMLDSEAAELAETLNEQLFNDIGEYNYGDDQYPQFYFKPLSKAMLKVVIDTWKDLVTAKAVEVTDTDEAYLRDLLDFPEKGEPVHKEPEQQPDGVKPITPTEGDPEQPGDVDKTPSSEPIEETVRGRKRVSIEHKLFSLAQARVDFAAIDRSSNVAQFQGVNLLTQSMKDILDFTTQQLHIDSKLGTADGVKAFKLSRELMAELRKRSKRILITGWDIGQDNGKQELEKAGKAKMSKKDFIALTEVAAKEFFNAKAFTMAGKLSDDALSIIKNILFNGIKFSKSTEGIIQDMYRAFGQNGLIDQSTLDDLLEEALDVKNPRHRLETVVRTNVFEAMNEARFSLFTQDEFVTALEYSAILDSRTTDICKQLDNKVLLARADEWDMYRPPNHFNCRSLLVPVTQADEVKVTGLPKKVRDGDIQPGEGFM